ncbi:hypothetical protein E4U43_008413 [Claviceps pusilla]|uniref:Uncharacterized protein n=1 Tax=Claviceps pusilla TaxID=123648 RepID=A0A9P7ND89_9HYPO|nr:hypothetical protein E4U43_008413 [Claviceps pusilla]
MFGAFPITPTWPPAVNPEDVPEPTQISLPAYQPIAEDDNVADKSLSLPTLLQGTGRDSIVLGRTSLLALGVNLTPDVQIQDLLPSTACLPDFASWDTYSSEQALEYDGHHPGVLRNGAPSPGCHVYLERRRELTNTNEDAFRTVRRITPPKGKQQARLGNAYEFFRCLELFTGFWDDTSQPPNLPPSPELTASDAAAPESPPDSGQDQPPASTRIFSGASMPAEYRQHLLNAFIKLVAYDFGCNVSMARVEPRLHLQSPPGRHERKSYTPSNCHFVFQSPTTREDARLGVVWGPVAAVTARPTVDFTTPDAETAQSQDLAREVTAALITAQHRNREGKEEVRFGHEKWWSTKHRWGGGVGGPIGREIEKSSATAATAATAGDGNTSAGQKDNVHDGPANKKARRTLPIYDNYRMVRPPPSSWDRKARYEAIGKTPGTTYDDIFILSSLFHHMSILRVRVPTRLLDVLDGSPEPDATKRSWGKVEAWRSPWYDFFQVDQRVAAMQSIWAVMAHLMRGGEHGK